MEVSTSRSGEGIRIDLQGEVVIREAALLKEILLKHLAEEKYIQIDLDKVTKIDTSGLQLLYAAYQTATNQKKKLFLERPSSTFMEAARLAGLFFQTTQDKQIQEGHLEGCLWNGGAQECQKPL